MQFYFSYVKVQLCFLANIFLGVFLNFCIFWNTSANSALTTTIVGNLKSVLVMFVSILFFSTVTYTTSEMAGLLLNLFGGVLYSTAKYFEMKEREKF